MGEGTSSSELSTFNVITKLGGGGIDWREEAEYLLDCATPLFVCVCVCVCGEGGSILNFRTYNFESLL